MLWYRGWLETRGRLLFVLIMNLVILLPVFGPAHGNAPGALRLLTGTIAAFTAVLAGVLAGNGIRTEPSFRPIRGVHASAAFTLSMPVSRLRLYTTRTAVGWLEASLAILLFSMGAWIAFPVLQHASSGAEMLRYALVLILCNTGIYGAAALLASWLEDVWRVWGTILFIFFLWWIPDHAALPAYANIIGAMSSNSPPMTHSMPWGAATFAVMMGMALCWLGFEIARRKEY